MVHYLDIAGQSTPADFSIMTLAQLAKTYGTDITGLAEVFQNFSDEVEYIEVVANIGVMAFNAGAKREKTGKEYTIYDMYDALSSDMSLAEALINHLFTSMRGDAVFPAPPATAEKKKSRKRE